MLLAARGATVLGEKAIVDLLYYTIKHRHKFEFGIKYERAQTDRHELILTNNKAYDDKDSNFEEVNDSQCLYDLLGVFGPHLLGI